uniref:Variant surface glycoprotein 1006 n=1 Tax=Trypanosoma brucei TaxID=5691 RepID=M4SXD8_9TRYP|nr:variant surface glycoprotein 1006 [Trypanosoma brucei]APD73295.1 variant surface glycoprotein 1125.1010 [Trypanosoma brucei]
MHTTEAVCAAVLAVSSIQSALANSAAGENAREFAALCGLYNLAAEDPAIPTPDLKAIAEIAHNIGAINNTLAPEPFKANINKDKDIAAMTGEAKAPKEEPELGRWTKYYDFWQNAEKTRQDPTKAAAYNAWAAAGKKIDLSKQVINNAERAYTLLTEATAKANTLMTNTVKTKQKSALYGVDTSKEARTTYGSSGRADICGKVSGSTLTTTAGASLHLDFLCLCAFATSGNDGGKSCCENCGGSDNDNDNWEPNSDASRAYNTIVANCKTAAPIRPLSEASVAAALTEVSAVLDRYATGKTHSNVNVLGVLKTGGTSCCTGNAAANAGRCVQYKADGFSGTEPKIHWAKELIAAGREADSLRDVEKQINLIQRELTALNHSTNNLLWTAQAISSPQGLRPNSQASEGAPNIATKNQQEAENACNAAKDEKTACENLKEKGCTYNDSKLKGQKCTLSEEAKQKAAEAAAKQEAGEKGEKPDCSKLGTQTECEAVNKAGQPASAPRKCGWITFTEKDGKLPKPR